MIIRFEASNFRSFGKPVELLLTAGLERRHRGRLSQHEKLGLRILPIAAIYGGNASGKTNITRALRLLKNLVVIGRKPSQGIPRHSFKLLTECAARPTRLAVEFLANDEHVYRYVIEVTDNAVHYEELVHIRPASEKVLFRRREGEKRFEVGGLGELANDKERRLFFKFSAEGTRPNQPFLHEAIERDVTELAPVTDWFKHSLEVVGPSNRPTTLEVLAMDNTSFRDFLRERLHHADVGISDLEDHMRPLNEVKELPDKVQDDIAHKVKSNESVFVTYGPDNEKRLIVRLHKGKIMACQIRGIRTTPDGTNVAFDQEDESDGTRRLIDLSVALYLLQAKQSRNVFVVDELDRSLHPVLCRAVLDAYLSRGSSDSRCQLIVTTHDVTLMTQELFRRDEVFLMEKEVDGCSSVHSLGDFSDLRHDKVLRRNYLQGRFGGIPVISK
jgi:AAA15 family ATPase/GTPase